MKYKEYLKYLLVIPTVGVLLLGNYLWNLKIDSRIDKKLQSNVKVGYNGEIVQPYNLVTDNTTTSATSTNWLGSIRPSADSSFDLGSSSLRWRNIYSSGTSTLTNLVLNGNVGINSSSPIASLAVQGVGGTNPFSINSSTGASMLTVLTNGNVGIGSSTANAGTLLTLGDTGGVAQLAFTPRTGTTMSLGVASDGSVIKVFNGVTSDMVLRFGGVDLGADGQIRWTNTTNNPLTTTDVSLSRYAAGVLAVGDGQTSGNASGTLLASKLGIGTTTPVTNLQVTASAANTTSTLTVGKAGQNKGSCLELYDSAGTAVYAYVLAGGSTFTLSANSCK